MVTTICMIVLVLVMAGTLIIGCKKGDEKTFFDKDNTGVMRGLFSIVILLVHVPTQYQNTIQDMIGSFAYVGVSFFFMTSAYGLMLGFLKNPDSLKHFFRKRLIKLLIPMVLVNILFFGSAFLVLKEFHFDILFNVNKWILQLLFFYIIYFVTFRFVKKSIKVKTIIVSTAVVAFSFLAYFFYEYMPFSWASESFGFIYGLILAQYKSVFFSFSQKKWFLKTALVGAMSMVFGVLYLKFKYAIFVGDYIVKIMLCLFITLLILLINTKISLSNFAGRFLSGVSYEIYLVHTHVFMILSTLFAHMSSGTFIILSIVISLLSAKIVNMLSVLIQSKIKSN